MIDLNSEKKKILIITRYFLPYFPSMGGVMRVFTLANYFTRMGLEVHILTGLGKYYGYFGYEYLTTLINIKYVGKSEGFFEKQFESKSETTLFKSIPLKSINLFRSLLERLSVPDKNIFYVNLFHREALCMISENNIKNVFISSPPHSMQLIGYLLKKDLKTKINIIADYRDSWNTTSIFKHKTYLGFMLSKRYEKKILLSCDKFTYVSEPILNKVEKLHNIEIRDKSYLVMNGYNGLYSDNDSVVEEKDATKIKVGYFGNLNSGKKSYRDITNLIHILLNNEALAEKFEFYFYGSIKIKHPGVSALKGFHINQPLSHEEAIEKMREMDYLMIVHSDPASSDEVITGKFFEYIAVRKPIICLAPLCTEAGRLVEKYQIGIHIDLCNMESLRSALLKITKPGPRQFYSDLDTSIFSRDIQYSKLLKLLN
jgi:glycosyltransferase involved in cell wall biosynthesis